MIAFSMGFIIVYLLWYLWQILHMKASTKISRNISNTIKVLKNIFLLICPSPTIISCHLFSSTIWHNISFHLKSRFMTLDSYIPANKGITYVGIYSHSPLTECCMCESPVKHKCNLRSMRLCCKCSSYAQGFCQSAQFAGCMRWMTLVKMKTYGLLYAY